MDNLTTITQNNKLLASLEKDQTVVLHTNDRKMIGDIVIRFTVDGNISYRNNLTTVPAGKTAIIKCDGLIVREDIIIRTSLQSIINKLATPIIFLEESEQEPAYTTEPNEYGTTIILNRYTEEPNDVGITIIIT